MDELTLAILKLYSERHSLSLSDISVITNCGLKTLTSPVYWLFKNGYLKICDPRHQGEEMYTVSTKLRITQEGRNYLSQQVENSKSHKINEFRSWTALALSAIAIIVSIIALIKSW